MSPDPFTQRHEVGDPGPWRQSLVHERELARTILTRPPLGRDAADLLECDRDRAAVASLFPDAVAERDQAIVLGAASAHVAALLQSHDEGWVELMRDGAARCIPAAATGLTPGLWLAGWSLALIARDRGAAEALCHPGTIERCVPPADRADPFWPPLFSALAAVVQAPDRLPERVRIAREALAAGEPAVLEPGQAEHLLLPLLSVGEALVAGDDGRLNAALQDAVARHAAWYGQEGRRQDRTGFLAFGLLALAAVSHDRGRAVRVDSEYLPNSLIEGRYSRAASEVTYVYPLRRLDHPDEARWFLDLEGFPRSRRSHRLLEIDGRIVARYLAEGAPGVPRARADFVVAPVGAEPDPDRGVEAALDVGELVLIADQLAERAGDEALPRAERRALLSEAADALDDALQRVPPDATSVPPAAFSHARGRAASRVEPGRYTRARLSAARDVWRRSSRAGPEDDDRAEAARAAALGYMEEIRRQVTPILEAVARDPGGEPVRQLQPRQDDYDKVFVGEAADVARQAYQVLWSAPPDLPPRYPDQIVVRSFLAPAGMLREDNELSRHFPGGYRSIAAWLNPHRIWLAWKYTRPDESSGLAFDGLVWCDDHWAWFPKPYRALGALASSPPPARRP